MTHSIDLLISGATVVTPEGVKRADIAIANGTIVAVGTILGPAEEEMDATGLHAISGILDSHVHFNEPGRADWEGIETGSKSLAAGGGTAFFDMPLNSLPPVTTAEAFAAKLECARRLALTDFAIWGGLVPGNVDDMGPMCEAGAIGFKSFMCNSGVEEFPFADADTLRKGMKRAAELGLLVAVHAEDDTLARHRTVEQHARGSDVRTWLKSRPVELELAAIRIATDIAGETGCALHIVHVSSPEGVDLALQARAKGVDVTVETCPHYLLLEDEDVVRLGAPAKCFPPLRPHELRLGLWDEVEQGRIDTIGSDHSPAPPGMKRSDDFFEIWGGISGCQHGFGLLLSEALKRRPAEVALPQFSSMLSANVARRFKIGRKKGSLAVGFDADITLLDLNDPHELSNRELLYKHTQGPYNHRKTTVRIARTIVRGNTVFSEGRIAQGTPPGHLIRPD